ncbi:heterokaryon incompatibility protein-domain-containing protein [Xylariaceae sp. FL1272]|nr:heterokaryon incompatibility protein-domain-containing protein [Xylariaceae sp. FL1272]
MQSPFPFPKLEPRQIRLLTFCGKNTSQKSHSGVHVELEVISLDDQDAQFLALSYVWGPHEPTISAMIGGRPVEVVPSVIQAIQHIQALPGMEGQRIWIDALCINQKDDTEKSTQVDVMGDIYRKADRVLMWLGQEADNSHQAMELLRSFAHVDQLRLEEFFDRTKSDVTSWNALEKLFQREYWGRVWILQEIVLSKSTQIVCGMETAPWTCVEHLLRRDSFKDYIVIPTREQRVTVLDRRLLPILLVDIIDRRKRGEATLLDYLILSRQRSATVTQDHVYGIMGLMTERMIQANYEKTTEEVYKELVTYMLFVTTSVNNSLNRE